MAKVYNNIFVRGLSGKLGDQFIVKTDKSGRTIVSAKPTFNGTREFSPAQLMQQQAFREAAAYAKEKKGEEIYITKASGGTKSPYNLAVADWFNRPKILEVDLTAWYGQAGDMIRMRAQDDVMVDQVTVTISDGTDTVLESGQANDTGGLWWEYATNGNITGQVTVTIAARDLPGHVTEYSQVRTFSG